jgi:hypothetical protein
MVRRLVAPEKLLEWKIEDGWAPLCKFLGKKVPEDVPFPQANDASGFKKRVEADLEGLGRRAMVNMGLVLLLFGGLVVWLCHTGSVG